MIRKVHADDWSNKTINLTDVIGVTVSQKDELNSTIEKDNELLKARSRSLLSRFRKDNSE